MSGPIAPKPALPLGPVIVDVDGLRLTDADRDLLRHPLVGGLIFFSRNFQSREQLLALVAEIRAVRPNLVLAVDQEGGRVQRFKKEFTLLPAMQSFWQTSQADIDSILPQVADCGWLMASEILACDIDISFAPVLDVDDCFCAVIANRSFAPVPHAAARLAGAFIDGMHSAGMACTGKHFPGHGSVREDSHLDLPVDPRSFTELNQHDLIPFITLLPQLDAVMPAHLVVPSVDTNAVGFSATWLQEILRKQLGFQGIIFSDDLSMAGAVSVGSYGDRAELALAAGCDAVLVCNNRAGAEEVLTRLDSLQIVANDRLASMRKKNNSPSWQSLYSEPRWQATQTRLMSLVQSGSK